MADTKISYVDKSWNPSSGCTPCSPGCDNCFAAGIAKRFWGNREFSDVQCHEDRLEQPLHWRKPCRILVPSMGDLFHKDVPFEFIGKVYSRMEECPQHTFLVLTKRIERALEHYKRYADNIEAGTSEFFIGDNIHHGATVCNQKEADEKCRTLLEVPSAKRWVSVEPLLGPIRFRQRLDKLYGWIDWVVVGCESGPGRRPCKLEWIKSLVEQCEAAGVKYMVKQMEIDGKVCHDLERIKAELGR